MAFQYAGQGFKELCMVCLRWRRAVGKDAEVDLKQFLVPGFKIGLWLDYPLRFGVDLRHYRLEDVDTFSSHSRRLKSQEVSGMRN